MKSKKQVLFTPNAWLKMSSLVMNTDKEICWHGLIKQLNNYSYIVYDILVHPQRVTGATVRVDDEAYAQWMNELTDEQFNNMKFEGHSHVNMSVNPSQQDLDTELGIAQQIPEKSFYIFLIMNKKNELKFRIYTKENGEVECREFNRFNIMLDTATTTISYTNVVKKEKINKTVVKPKFDTVDIHNKKYNDCKKFTYDDDYDYMDFYNKLYGGL